MILAFYNNQIRAILAIIPTKYIIVNNKIR